MLTQRWSNREDPKKGEVSRKRRKKIRERERERELPLYSYRCCCIAVPSCRTATVVQLPRWRKMNVKVEFVRSHSCSPQWLPLFVCLLFVAVFAAALPLPLLASSLDGRVRRLLRLKKVRAAVPSCCSCRMIRANQKPYRRQLSSFAVPSFERCLLLVGRCLNLRGFGGKVLNMQKVLI